MEYNVPFVADVRISDVGQHSLAVPRSTLVHAEDKPSTCNIRYAVAAYAVHLQHGSTRV